MESTPGGYDIVNDSRRAGLRDEGREVFRDRIIQGLKRLSSKYSRGYLRFLFSADMFIF